jgi:hypothetical protein
LEKSKNSLNLNKDQNQIAGVSDLIDAPLDVVGIFLFLKHYIYSKTVRMVENIPVAFSHPNWNISLS